MQVKSTVTTSLTQHASGINNARHRVQEFLRSLPENSIISANIRRIGQNHLLLMFRTVASLGLDRWAPDVLSNDPESMYNLLHEHIALLTFEQVSGAFGYAFIGNNLAFTHDFALLRKIYRSFVFAYMSKIVRSENKKPGSVARTKEMVNVWKRRDDVCLLLRVRKFLLIILYSSKLVESTLPRHGLSMTGLFPRWKRMNRTRMTNWLQTTSPFPMAWKDLSMLSSRRRVGLWFMEDFVGCLTRSVRRLL